jgi:hypothetical protein
MSARKKRSECVDVRDGILTNRCRQRGGVSRVGGKHLLVYLSVLSTTAL